MRGTALMHRSVDPRARWTAPVLALLMLLAGAASAHAEDVWALTTTNALLRFDTAAPGTLLGITQISGLQPGESLLNIDFRPANGRLYGLGSTSRLYTVDPGSGVATQVGATGAFVLNGTAFGFDFNPTVDRIRVV